MARRYISKIDRQFYKLDRERQWLKQNKLCYYCKKKLNKDEITYDHVIPISKTGYHSSQNCVVACWDCNQAKADNTDYRYEPPERDEIEQMIDAAFERINEGIRQFEYTWAKRTMGSYNKWVKYWEKRGRWN